MSDSSMDSVVRPPPASPAVAERRFRSNRLSTRLSYTANAVDIELSISPSSRVKIIPPDKQQLKEIYANCLDLFQAKKITVENAFSLKLIECLEDVISSPDFDFTNLQLVGRTLEAGTRIYVCRVDYTYDMVMKLVAQVGAKGKNLERLRKEMENQNASQLENGNEPDDYDPDDPDQAGDKPAKKQQRQKKKKTCFSLPLEKLRMKFNENTKCYITRKELVKDLFTKFIENRVYFDYNWVLGQVDAIREARIKAKPEMEEEEEAQKVTHTFTRLGNEEMATSLKFLPYIQFPDEALYDRSIYDCWGRPKKGPGSAEEERRLMMEARKAQLAKLNAQKLEEEERARAEYAFDPAEHTDYAADNRLDDDDDRLHEGPEDEYGGMDTNKKIYDLNTSLKDINSLDELHHYYAALKELNKERVGAHFWALPAFMRQKSGRPPVKSRKKKNEPQRFKFSGVDWKDPANRYLPVTPDKIEFDDRTIERWTWTSRNVPYMEARDIEEDEDEFTNAFIYPCRKHEDYVTEVLQYFIDPSRNILQQFVPKGTKHDTVNDNGDWEDVEDENFNITGIEDMRNLEYNPSAENGGSAPRTSGEFEAGSGALNSFMNEFPCSHPGFDIEDDDYEAMLGETGEGHGIKFARQPKPINMRILKQIIVDVLCDKLSLNPEEKIPLTAEETRTDFLALIREVFKRADERTQKHLTISLLLVALLHVVVELKLFMDSNSGAAVENMDIICRGSAWNHKDHIPMPKAVEVPMEPSEPDSDSHETNGIDISMNSHSRTTNDPGPSRSSRIANGHSARRAGPTTRQPLRPARPTDVIMASASDDSDFE